MNLRNKRIFVSGAAGVIGREMVRKLVREGAIVLAADRKSRPQDLPKNVLYRQGDLNFISKEELERFEPEIFFHLAASFERSTESYEFWQENFNDNILLSHHLATILKDSPSLKKIIFASSYLIYNQDLYSFDTPQEKPYSLKETDPIYPRNLTGCAKLNYEIELDFIREFKPKIHISIARIYRGYGRGSRDVISRFVRALLKNEKITVYSQENIFDYIFAEDTAEGLIRLSKTGFSGITNLGSGKSRKISELVEILQKHFPKMLISYKTENIKYEASQAEMSKYQKLTGWVPENSLEQGVKKIIDFEKKQKTVALKNQFGNVLISSVAQKIPMVKAVTLAARKISPEVKVFGGDLNGECLGKYFVDKFYKMPRAKQKNLDKIIDYCRKNEIKSIIPSRDGELEFFAKNKDHFLKSGIKIMVSNLRVVEITIDKLKFYQKFSERGFPAIPAGQKIEEIKADRFVVKERFGAGSDSLGLNLTKIQALEHAKRLEKPIFQPFIEGREFSVDVYIDQSGRAKGAVVRERTLVVAGESKITETQENKKLEEVCLRAAETFPFYGHIIFQVIIDSRGKFHFVECNARFGGASTLSIASGLDSFYWFLLEASGEKISDYPFIKSKKQIKQVRHQEDFRI